MKLVFRVSRLFGSTILLTAAAVSAPAFAQSLSLDIPAEDATAALRAFSRQADVQILSARRDTRHKTTNAVHGVMSAQQALDQMLEGTGLYGRQTGRKTFAILPFPQLTAPVQQADAAAALQVAGEPPEPPIVVTGLRQSLRASLRAKQRSDVISDNISSDEIGQLPNVTIAEELNRLPGVNTTRDRGNASQASVRGMGPRFVLGLLNGREIATSEPSQEVRWEVYPFEIVSGVQVYKAQDSAIVPGGIAAAIDIRTVKPLSYTGKALTIDGGPTYNTNGKQLPGYGPWGYRGSAGYITHLRDNLAVAIAASAQRKKNGYPNFSTWGWNTAETGLPGDLNGDGRADNTPYGLQSSVSELHQDRYGIMANAGWRPASELTLNFDALYSRYIIADGQTQSWFGNNMLGNWDGSNASVYNAPGATYTIENGSVVAAHLPGSFPNYQSVVANYRETHDLLAGGMNAAWTKGSWDLTLDLSHSTARRSDRWEAVELATQYASGLDFDLRGKPSATLSGPAVWDPSIQFVSIDRWGRSDGPEHARDTLSAVAADAKYSFDGGFLTSVQLGARLSDRAKKHRLFGFALCPGSTTAGSCDQNAHDVSLTNYLKVDSFPGYTAPLMLFGDWATLWNAAYPYPAAQIAPRAEQLLQHTRVGVRSAEAFGKTSFETNLADVPVSGSFGVRVANTRVESSGFQQNMDGTLAPVTVRNRYTDVLPTLNVTAELSPKQLLRLGAGQAISRAPLDALVTGFVLNAPVPGQIATGGGGNPTLRPFKSRQIDVSYENYFHAESLFAVALFYKQLEHFIGSGAVHRTFNGTDYLISTLTDAKGGHVYGLETTFQTRFYFLPGMLKNFGVYANYAFANTNVHEFAPSSNPYPMVGSARHTAQVDGFYSRGPVELRLSAKYHSSYVIAPTWVATMLRREDPETLVDASLSYQINKRLGLRLQAANLTDAVNRQTTDNNPMNLAIYQRFGRSFLMDISFKM